MERRRAVKQHRMAPCYFLENIPNLGGLALNHLFCRPDSVHIAQFFQPANDERLEQHERHLFGQPTLMQLELRTDNNDGTPGIIDAFAVQVFPETPDLSFKYVTEGFESVVAVAGLSTT